MRRDFTVNAMAVDADGVIYDYFDGVSDLDRKRLRTVGESSKRFSEDALRLFRACRFLGQLDFMADRSLIDGMPSAFERVKGLSLERVESEIDRLIVTPHAARGFDLLVRTGLNECFCHATEYGKETEIAILPELSHLVGLPQQKEFHKFDGWYHTLAVLDASKPLLINRWAALLHDVGKGMPGVRGIHKGRLTDYGHDKKGAEMTRALLKHWKRPKALFNRVTWLVRKSYEIPYHCQRSEITSRQVDKADCQRKSIPDVGRCIGSHAADDRSFHRRHYRMRKSGRRYKGTSGNRRIHVPACAGNPCFNKGTSL